MARGRGPKYTPEQIDTMLANQRLKLYIGLVLAAGFSAGLFALMCTPLAKSIAGTDTNFNLSISVAINFALAISTATTGAGCIVLDRRRRHHLKRARKLEARLVQAGQPVD